MGFCTWLLRCIPALSVLLLLVLVECALKVFETEYIIGLGYPTGLIRKPNPVFAQFLFIAYSAFLHVLALVFPFRLWHSISRATSQIEAVHRQGLDDVLSRKSATREDAQDVVAAGPDGGMDTIHAIMLPSYKEDIGTLEDTLKVLAGHTLAMTCYDVYLAMEARDPDAVTVATTLVTAFKHRFRDMQYTVHPAGLPGEVPAKSSNINWASKQVRRKYHDHVAWKDVLLTVMDSDTHLLSDYFKLVRRKHIHNRQQGDKTDMSLYMPPIVMDRNAHKVPRLVRIVDIMWVGAGLSCFQNKSGVSGVAFPTAVYTVTLPLVELVNGWDTGSGAIGEDMHMMLKCYFATNAKLAIQSIASPASHCNITTEKLGIRGWIHGHRARYVQGLRHMWGCLDSGFAITHWLNLGKKPPGSTGASSRPRKLSHTELELKLSQYQLHGEQGIKFTWRNLVLFIRLFEAHFLPIHFFIVLVASATYTSTLNPLVHCSILSMFLYVTDILRNLNFLVMVATFFFGYERYHDACVRIRLAEMKRMGLYEEMKDDFTFRDRSNPRMWLDYLLFPIAGTIFGAVPLMQAAFTHFWTDQLIYTVSEKPKRLVIDPAAAV